VSGWAVQEDDPLVRDAVARALAGSGAAALGRAQAGDGRRRQLIGVHGLLGVACCPLRRAGQSAAGRVAPGATAVLYVMGDPLAAELHRLHGCSDLACVFWPEEGGGRFEPLAWPGRLESAGLTPREADVLALLLARRTNDEIAAQLVLSSSTVRAHCRAVLRKLGARDRRHLWSLLPPATRW
jgi:DNA-binding CsgD family transcriptional regulator